MSRDRKPSFSDFFEKATGHTPHDDLARLARDGLPERWTIPPGIGKTAIILAWLWRRLAGECQSATPRRLVYVLPQRAQIEPAANDARTWLANLGLTDEVALHVPMAAWSASHGDWRQDMHRPAIIVGTADILLSKVLNRGFGVSRTIAPIEFALLTNGAHWVMASPGRCPVTAATLRDIATLAADYGTAEPFGCTRIHSERPEPSLTPPVPAPVLGAPVLGAPVPGAPVLGRAAIMRLFDTAPSPDAEIGIVPYVQDGDDLDAEVAWATWAPAPDGAPDPEVRRPAAEYRHRVPLGRIPELAAGRAVWRWNPETDGYIRVGAPGQSPVRPYELLLVDAADGGYDPVIGFAPASRVPVTGSPELRTPDEEIDEAPPGEERQWQSLDEHSQQVRDQAEALLRVLAPDIPDEAARSVVLAGYLHDLGKGHPIWQDALCALAAEEDRERIAAGRPWAKSGGPGGRLEFAGGVSFRHELGSLLLIDGPLRHLRAEAPDPDLVRYGVLAHHGRLRVHVRDDEPAVESAVGAAAGEAETEGQRVIRGLVHGATTAIPAMLAQPATQLTPDLTQFGDGDSPWTRTVRALLARYGPFRLAYLETVVRIADWRASARAELPTGSSPSNHHNINSVIMHQG